MKYSQTYLFPTVKIIAIPKQEYDEWTNLDDLGSVACLNTLLLKITPDSLFTEDASLLPTVELICLKYKINLYETYSADPEWLATGITAYSHRNPAEGLYIVIVPKKICYNLSLNLYNRGFIVLDRTGRSYMKPNPDKFRDQCCNCGEYHLVYQEGALICLDCGCSFEG